MSTKNFLALLPIAIALFCIALADLDRAQANTYLLVGILAILAIDSIVYLNRAN